MSRRSGESGPPGLPAPQGVQSVDVEATFDEFVSSVGGEKVSGFVGASPPFENADYLFRDKGVIVELKECTTEFAESVAFLRDVDRLAVKYIALGLMDPDPKRRGPPPSQYVRDLMGLFKPPISRILKKANRQVRSTRQALKMPEAPGVLVFVNDAFTSVEPMWVRAIACDLLSTSYSAITCFLYVTVNSYVAIPTSDYLYLVWAPTYAPDAPDSLVAFIDGLGTRWNSFLEAKVGPWDTSLRTGDHDVLNRAEVIGDIDYSNDQTRRRSEHFAARLSIEGAKLPAGLKR